MTYMASTHPSVPGCRGEVRCLPGGPLLVPLGQLPEETAEPGVGRLGRGILLLVLEGANVTQLGHTNRVETYLSTTVITVVETGKI